MLIAPLPPNEDERLAALHSLQILDTLPEERFERITRLAQRVFDVPIASITLFDAHRQWFKSCLGLSMRATSRDVSFCAHAILGNEALVIPDARLDPRFADNPLVTGDPHIRFYSGYPLGDPYGNMLGTLCIIDLRPRQMSAADLQALKDLARCAESELNTMHVHQVVAEREQVEEKLRATLTELEAQYREAQRTRSEIQAVLDAASDAMALVSPDQRFLMVDQQFTEIFGLGPEEVLGRRFSELQQELERTFPDPGG